MLPLQFIFLLIVASLPGELVQAAQDSTGNPAAGLDQWPVWHGISAPMAYLSLAVCQGLMALIAIVQTRGAIRALHEPGAAATPISAKVERTFSQIRWATGVLTGIHLFSTPLAADVIGWFSHTVVLKHLLVPELLFMLPAVLTWIVLWAEGYHLENSIRERNLPYNLARHEPVHEMPGLGAYLLMQMRHNFFPMIFLAFKLVVKAGSLGLLQISSAMSPETAESIASFMALLVGFATLPGILVRVWSTTPLTGALRERLDAVAARHGFKFRNILLWRSHNMLINAAIVGWLPRGRYFLMSDVLVESFSDEQLESVFAHEVGHGVHRHLWWLAGAVISAAILATGAGTLGVWLLHLPAGQEEMASMTVASVLLCGFAAAAVWIISPRFEHQADWFACQHMAKRVSEGSVLWDRGVISPGPAVAAVGTGVSVAPPGIMLVGAMVEQPAAPQPAAGEAPPAENAATVAPRLTDAQVGAEIFVTSLESIVETSHRDRERRGWFHPSVASRARLCRELSANPAAAAQFDRRLRNTRYWILVLAGAAATLFTISLLIPEPVSHTPTPPPQSAPAAPATHP